MHSNVVTPSYLPIKALNYILNTYASNVSHGTGTYCLYSMCVFMLHVRIHWTPQRGNLCLQCRRHQCLLSLGARLLWRWDCPISSSSTAPTSAPVATHPPFPPARASSLYATLQPSLVVLNGWVTTRRRTSAGSSQHKKQKIIILYVKNLKKIQLSCMQGEDDVPPRPPLPQLYSPDEHPPAVPPLPRETTVIRHTSVRGLKRQSDERKRDREIGQYTNGDSKVRTVCEIHILKQHRQKNLYFLISVCPSQVELRPFLSDPELMGAGDGSSHITVAASGHDGYQTLPSSRGTKMTEPVGQIYLTGPYLFCHSKIFTSAFGYIVIQEF